MNSVSIMSLIFVGISATSYVDKILADPTVKNMAAERSIEEVIKEHSGELMSISGVVGVGQGLCDKIPCIKVYIIKRTPELDKKIPALLEGYEVSIEITGEIRAHPGSP